MIRFARYAPFAAALVATAIDPARWWYYAIAFVAFTLLIVRMEETL